MTEAEAKAAKVETSQPIHAEASWHKLSVNDIKSLARLADQIHPDPPKSDEVSAERVSLFPEGCLGLLKGKGKKELCGYAISHPIKHRHPPTNLNRLLAWENSLRRGPVLYPRLISQYYPSSEDGALRRRSALTSSFCHHR